jgi:hypothetical protein
MAAMTGNGSMITASPASFSAPPVMAFAGRMSVSCYPVMMSSSGSFSSMQVTQNPDGSLTAAATQSGQSFPDPPYVIGYHTLFIPTVMSDADRMVQ